MVRSLDIVLLVSAALQVPDEEPMGVRLGFWAYFAVVTSRYPLGIAGVLTGVT